MSAIPHDFLHATAQLGKTIARPYPNSRKAHIQGSRPDLQVPLREISQDATPPPSAPKPTHRSRFMTVPVPTPIRTH